MNVSTKGNNSYRYVITNDKDCTTQLSENAQIKLLALHTDVDGSYCILVWTCRTSREGVHAFCTKTKLSVKQKKWIASEYKRLGLSEVKVVHNTDYKNGECFNKKE